MVVRGARRHDFEDEIGLTIALAIGAGCRCFNGPVPAPQQLVGAMLIVAITLGYLGPDFLMRDPGSADR